MASTWTNEQQQQACDLKKILEDISTDLKKLELVAWQKQQNPQIKTDFKEKKSLLKKKLKQKADPFPPGYLSWQLQTQAPSWHRELVREVEDGLPKQLMVEVFLERIVQMQDFLEQPKCFKVFKLRSRKATVEKTRGTRFIEELRQDTTGWYPQFIQLISDHVAELEQTAGSWFESLRKNINGIGGDKKWYQRVMEQLDAGFSALKADYPAIYSQLETQIQDKLKVLREMNQNFYQSSLQKETWKTYFKETEDKLTKVGYFLPRNQLDFNPPAAAVFNAFQVTLEQIKVVIMGQCPTPSKKILADGLAYSSFFISDSTSRIFAALEGDTSTGFTSPKHGNLQEWVDQGVLLLNCVLTGTRNSQAHTHKYYWSNFTHAVLRLVIQRTKHVVFMAWGLEARTALRGVEEELSTNATEWTYIEQQREHKVLTCDHPSPMSLITGENRIEGANHFSTANSFLQEKGREEIIWNLPDRPFHDHED